MTPSRNRVMSGQLLKNVENKMSNRWDKILSRTTEVSGPTLSHAALDRVNNPYRYLLCLLLQICVRIERDVSKSNGKV